MIAIINKTDVVLSKKEYQEYLEYKAQANKEAKEWDNCHCTCGLLDYIEDDDKEVIHDLFEETETLFDITDDLTGTINFNQKIQRLVNRQ